MKKYIFLTILITSFLGCRRQATTTVTGPTGKIAMTDIMENNQTEPQDKYNEVAQMFVILLEQGLAKNDAGLVQDILLFEQNHYYELNNIAEELDDWLKNMDDEERMYAIIDVVRRTPSRKLRVLVPRVEARLKPYPEQRKTFEKLMRTIELRR